MTMTEQEFKTMYPNGIIQGKKFFTQSQTRSHVWIWVNRPTHGKHFDYYMCPCGKIYSNAGFTKHKCNPKPTTNNEPVKC